jgi:hypothetical protein
MKLYIPSIGDIIKLEESWVFNCFHTYGNTDMLEHFGHYYSRSNNKFTKIVLPVGTELRVEKINIQKKSVHDSFTFSIKFDESKPKHITFGARLSDVNRIILKTTPTSGILTFPIQWDTLFDMPEKNTKIHGIYGKSFLKKSIGCVNGVDAFEISISEYLVDDSNFVKSIKYKLFCLLSDEVVGEWSTLSSVKKKANEYIEKNRKYFLGDEQKISMREEKFERILKKGNDENETN